MSSDPSLPALAKHPHIYGSVLELIADTPLVEVRRLGRDAPRAHVFGKLEAMNPGGSVKDRICLAMIERAEKDGKLQAGGVVVEPTSGNTGIGLALVCARRGYRCVLTMPASMSLERRQLLQSFGAEVVLTPEELQMEGAIAKAREIAAATKLSFMPQQFENQANPDAHFAATSQEIVHALDGQPLHAFVPKNYDARVVSQVRTVTDELAYQTKLDLARREGLLAGISSGANVAVALQVARELGEGKNVVTMLYDTGERYFSLDEYFKS
jgi:cysteine synthase A